MFGRRIATACLVALALLSPAGTAAQTNAGDPMSAQAGSGWFLGAGAGFGWGTITVGEDRAVGSRSGAVLLGVVGLSRGGAPTWGVETEAQLFTVPVPSADEGFRAYRALVRRSLGSPFYLAPGVGVEHRRWTGSERSSDSDTGLLLAVAFGRHVPVARTLALRPEISWSYAFMTRDPSASGAGVSLRVTAVRIAG